MHNLCIFNAIISELTGWAAILTMTVVLRPLSA